MELSGVSTLHWKGIPGLKEHQGQSGGLSLAPEPPSLFDLGQNLPLLSVKGGNMARLRSQAKANLGSDTLRI